MVKTTEAKKAYYFITVNKGAGCYNEFEKILKQEKEKNPSMEWSYILHEPDDENKNTHYHLVLHYVKTTKRFSTIQNLFPGANVQPSTKERYEKSIQYLIHLNNPDKKRYSSIDVISNLEQGRLERILSNRKYQFQFFDVNKTMQYIKKYYEAFGKVTIFNFVEEFGLSAIHRYYYSLNSLCKEYNNEMNQNM